MNRWSTSHNPPSPPVQPLTNATQAGRPYPLKTEGDPPALITLARAAALLRPAGLDEEERVWGRFALSVWSVEVCHQLFREAHEAYEREDGGREMDVDHADWLLLEVLRRVRRIRGTERESLLRLWHAAWEEYLGLRQSRAIRPPTPPSAPPVPTPVVQGDGPVDSEDDDWCSSDADGQSVRVLAPEPVAHTAESPVHPPGVEGSTDTSPPHQGSSLRASRSNVSLQLVDEAEGYRHPIMDQWNQENGPDGVVEQATRRLWKERLAKYSPNWH